MARPPFDPIAVLQALDAEGVRYIVVGALGRVIQGSPELTDGIDIVPSMKDENRRRLGAALEELKARRADGKPLKLERDLGRQPMLELRTTAGELKLVPEPVGTRQQDLEILQTTRRLVELDHQRTRGRGLSIER